MTEPAPRDEDAAARLWDERPALKEWAAVIRALEQDRQRILLRKGGIHERGFDVRHPRFFLFPTYLHQEAGKLRPETRDLYEETAAEGPGTERFTVRAVAEVVESFPLTARERLLELAARTVMTAEELDARYSWKPEQALHVLVVRAHRIPEVEVEMLPKYGGCRSWVNLEPELERAPLEPCTDPGRLAAELEAVRELVG